MQYNFFKTLDKISRIDIGLNAVTSFSWSAFGTLDTRAFLQVNRKTRLSMHGLMI